MLKSVFENEKIEFYGVLPFSECRCRRADLIERKGLRPEDIRSAALKNMAVVIGSEGQGVRKEVLESAQAELIIPMNANCESLNAAIAAAIVMWQMKV